MSNCSVVMVSYQTGPVLFAAIKGVLSQAGLADLVLVNNGNPPDVLARLQQMALTEPRIKIVGGQGNVGFAKACNLGARQAEGDFLLLLNPDCLLAPDALTGFMKALADTPGAVLAGGYLLNPDGSEQRGGRRQLLTPGTALAEALGLKRMQRLNNHETLMPEQTHEVPAISGACMCIRKSDYLRMFGLDEGFFLHVEDLDFCVRVHKSGGKVICVPSVRVTHMLSSSGGTSPRFIEWQKTKGFIRYFDKHFHGEYAPGVVPLVKLAVLARYGLKVARNRFSRPQPHSVAAKRLMILASGLADLPSGKEFEGKVVMVTGATSQVGLCVLRRLIAGNAAVLALSRGDAIPFSHPNLRWIKGDLTDHGLHLEGYLIDYVVHCAPLWHLPPALAVLADAEAQRIVAFGSTSVFGKALSSNAYEKDVVTRLAHAEAEIAERCAQLKLRWTVLRPTLIYGVGLDVNVTTLAKLIKRFGWFPVYPPAFGRRQPVHADDVALAALQALPSEVSFDKSYNLSGGEIVTYREMLERLFRLYGKATCIVASTLLPFALDVAGALLHKKHINGEIARRMNDDLVFFHDDASRDFGFSPRAFLSGGIRDIEGY